ncbi:YbhB/YbcL family Raf kinase inhibitor-like protein [Olivibacter sp. XZL3]|uniref:YbhB/YbcL family Raf kinase inhibitor-like protein n=1 Tax=Olivibacter sp. XZL3 TaxID=1735116 RepID=UPI001064D0F3|nr:YbhB/YbcL family Raf kinase inhibitor-like protein [Olivibacter sp. XZL3]
MKIRSTFEPFTEIPQKYTCLGLNVSPPLTFEEIPPETVSLVLLLEDMDATPTVWTHWHVFNIPPTTHSVEEGQIPKGGIEGLCNNHTFGYEGPCPKYFSGTHQYAFKLYALSKLLALPPTTEPEQIKEEMKGYIVSTAELVVRCTSDQHKSEAQQV